MGPRRAACIALAAVAVASLAPPRSIQASPVLLPPHVLGPVPQDATEALVGAFLDEISRRSGEPADRLPGDSCPDPASCERAEGVGDPRYWLQISGDDEAIVAVALRLDGAVERARATASAPPSDSATIGGSLAADVAAGMATGLRVDVGLRRATVWLDGEVVGHTPLTLERPIPAGLHTVRVEARDGRAALALIPVRAGETAVLQLDLSAVPRPSADTLADRPPFVTPRTPHTPREGPGAWPLLPVAIGAAVVGVLFATDPAGVFGPDYTIVVVAPGS